MSKLDSFFQVSKNVIYEHAWFNRRMELADESVEQFITNLYQLIEHCEYCNLRNKMMCHRIVVGIQDSTLSKRLQIDPGFTLEKAKKLIHQRETVREQQQFLTAISSEGATVKAVSKNSGH